MEEGYQIATVPVILPVLLRTENWYFSDDVQQKEYVPLSHVSHLKNVKGHFCPSEIRDVYEVITLVPFTTSVSQATLSVYISICVMLPICLLHIFEIVHIGNNVWST